MKGWKDEIDYKLNLWLSKQDEQPEEHKIKEMEKTISDSVIRQRYIIWDAETDTSSFIHLPNLIIVNVLETDQFNSYDRSSVESLKF